MLRTEVENISSLRLRFPRTEKRNFWLLQWLPSSMWQRCYNRYFWPDSETHFSLPLSGTTLPLISLLLELKPTGLLFYSSDKESVLTDFLQVSTLLMSVGLSAWAIPCSVNTQLFVSAASTAVLVERVLVYGTHAVTVRKDALSARSIFIGSLLLDSSSMWCDFGSWGCQLAFFNFQKWFIEYL